MKKAKKVRKKKTLRNSARYPELNPRLNLKGRQDYMDTSYVNGVKDKDGNTVIRGLNEEEKKFLSQFYKEWLNADSRNPELYTDENEWRAIFNENNARNRCLLNHAKKLGNLCRFDAKKGDRKFVKELGEYDLELMTLEHSDLNDTISEDKLDNVIKNAIKKLKK